jgi:hypothetical protein
MPPWPSVVTVILALVSVASVEANARQLRSLNQSRLRRCLSEPEESEKSGGVVDLAKREDGIGESDGASSHRGATTEHRIIAPSILYFGKPVVLISTCNADGSANLAPMSSAWALVQAIMLGLGGGQDGRKPGTHRRVCAEPALG